MIMFEQMLEKQELSVLFAANLYDFSDLTMFYLVLFPYQPLILK